MLRSFAYHPMWPLTRSSPSSPVQMTLTWGLPSRLMVLRWVRGPEAIRSRSSAGRALTRSTYFAGPEVIAAREPNDLVAVPRRRRYCALRGEHDHETKERRRPCAPLRNGPGRLRIAGSPARHTQPADTGTDARAAQRPDLRPASAARGGPRGRVHRPWRGVADRAVAAGDRLGRAVPERVAGDVGGNRRRD